MKQIVLKIGRITAVFIFIVTVVFGLVMFYEYYKVASAPVYNSNTMELNYELIGNGTKKLVLIHGLAGSKNYWKRDLEEITKTHSLLLIDLLGFGDSPKPKSNYNLSTQLKAIENVIKKENFNDGQTVIVGHSLGAIISLSLFAKQPNWFQGVTAIGLPIVTSKKQFIKNLANNSYFDKLAVSKYGKLVCMFHPIYTLKWFKPKNLTDEVFSDAKKHTWQSYYYSLNEIILKTNLYTKTMNIKNKKILFIQGDKDEVSSLESVINFSETFSKAKMVAINNGDHQLFLREPKKVWELINFNF